VVDLDNPLARALPPTSARPLSVIPRHRRTFRYAFVVDRDGLKVLDVTDLAQPKFVPNALVPLDDARNVYVARTYAYVSAGSKDSRSLMSKARRAQARSNFHR